MKPDNMRTDLSTAIGQGYVVATNDVAVSRAAEGTGSSGLVPFSFLRRGTSAIDSADRGVSVSFETDVTQ